MLKVFFPSPGDPVRSYSPRRGGDLPLRLHEFLFQETLQRRIERPFFHEKNLIRSLFNMLDQRVPMHWPRS